MWIDGTKIYERCKNMTWYRINEAGMDVDNDDNVKYKYRFVFESTDREVTEAVNKAIADVFGVVPYKNNIQEYTVK